MWKQNTAQVITLVISSTEVIPKSLPQSLKRQPASKYVYKNAKICNSWNMFNCKKFLITNKTTKPISVDHISRDR